MPGGTAPTVHQLKIGLEGAAPPLWRRIQIPSAASLGFLHDVIQQAFGWEGFHLHRFQDGRGREWGAPASADGAGFRRASHASEEEADLGTVLRAEGAVLWYVYDFGDDWRHRIEVEKILPPEPGVAYPRCTGGRRASSPAEDIGGIWGLDEIAYLVTHPGATPPEHFEDLVRNLRDTGYDPAAFDPGELTDELAGLAVRTAVAPARARTGTRRRIQRLTSEDLAFCTCGRCRAGDPVRSLAGGYLTEEVPAEAEAEVFPVITLPPPAELAAQARRAPLIEDALRLAEWCAPGRQVTAKGVLRPSQARLAIEELRLWERDDTLTDPHARATALAGLRSAGDLTVLDVPWQFAARNGFIAIRSGQAVAGPALPDPADSDQLLSAWQQAFESEVRALDDIGARVMPGVLSMFREHSGGLVFPLLKLLYRLPDEEWLDTGTLLTSPGGAGDGPGTALRELFAIETATGLLKILSDFGAAAVDRGTRQRRSDHAGAVTFFADVSPERPGYRIRLTPLGRYGIRNILVSDGHTARVAGELATADAATLIDALAYYQPSAFEAELAGWLAGRDEAAAITGLLDAAAGASPDLAARRVAAITVLTMAKPDRARETLRAAAASGPDGRRQVAAGVLAGLGEEPPLYRQTARLWLLVDLLTALSSAGDLRENLTSDILDALRAHADELWRCDHPAAAATMDAAAAAIRDSDKALAKRLRGSAHKARARR